jgi:hopanoid biosynthesis associated RND transporter like protein HpnN
MHPPVLVRVVDASRRRAVLVLLAALLLAGLSGWAAKSRLGVSTDTDKLFRSTLPWRQRQIAFERDFPQFKNQLVAVIDARIPEQADATAAALAAALRADPAHFRTVSQPDASPFLRRNGLLFLDPKTLTDLLGTIEDAQPFLGQLSADPSARGLLAALALIGVGVDRGQADLNDYRAALDGFERTLHEAADGHPQPLSWEQLLAGSLASQAGKYRFVLVQPKLDYGALEPGGVGTRILRADAAGLAFVRSGDARVRVTGSIALADEEFATVAEGVVWGTVGSVLLITLWLFLAVGSWRLILPILLTLLLGLALTTGIAALAVGTLNLVSVAFAILFIGIAVDFAIQFSVRYRELRGQVPDLAQALSATAQRAGAQILVAAAATAAGFYAFVPTSFSGVAELGLIAGTGMLIAFCCTLGFLPAALTLFRAPSGHGEVGFAAGTTVEHGLARIRMPVLAGFGALALLGAALLPRLTFDSDPLHTKNRHTEAMQVLADLMNDPITNPYSIDIIEPNAATAAATAARLTSLPLVAGTVSINSFVPADQPAKLALIGDAANLLAATLAPRAPAAPVTAEQLRMAIAAALAQIGPALTKLPADSPLARIDADLKRLATATDDTLLAMNAALTQFLPQQLDTLRLALQAKPVSIADIPPAIAQDWVLPDGRARLHVLAKAAARDSSGLHAFVRQVAAVAPNAGGSAVTIVATAATIIGAFRDAAIGALAAIALLLLVFLRRPLDAALVMAPLLLSALMTVVVLVVARIQLNFANIIALPLLLGVGVSFNIYFVMNWRAGMHRFLGSATARAVIFSAFTTGTAFGSLALSRHPGTASMGDLLLISLGCTLVASLVFIPTLLVGLDPHPANGTTAEPPPSLA